MRVILDPKRVTDVELVTVDFLSLLAIGETISTKVVTASVYSGTDASPSAIISGAATSSGTTVTQSIIGGVAGAIYYLLFTITTSLSQTRTIGAFLAVIPNAP